MTNLNEALRQFDATEANLLKLNRLWKEIQELIPKGVCFTVDSQKYDDKCRLFRIILQHLPSIGEFNISDSLMDLLEIAQSRMEATESMEIEYQVSTEEAVYSQGKAIQEYEFHFSQARKALVRDAVLSQVRNIDNILQPIKNLTKVTKEREWMDSVTGVKWEDLKTCITQLESLFGSSKKHPSGWSDLKRHLHFGQRCDLRDIIETDWPAIKSSLESLIYGAHDPLPISVTNLSDLVNNRPQGQVIVELDWPRLLPEDFERLVFNIVDGAQGYENPNWLTHTNAPDRGRDIEVRRTSEDSLAGISTLRVIIQCKHLLTGSVRLPDISSVKDQMKLWEPPLVDILVFATSGKFTTDAIAYVERHNLSSESMRIEMWPASHMEKILAKRPHLIAEFSLRI